jgi:general secretion pathway protein E
MTKTKKSISPTNKTKKTGSRSTNLDRKEAGKKMFTKLIGNILIEQGALTQDQCAQALEEFHQQDKKFFGEFLINQNKITHRQLSAALAEQWDLPFLETITSDQADPKQAQKLPLEFLKSQSVLPIRTDPDHPAIALADPLNLQAYDAVLNRLGLYAPRVICTQETIDQAISQCYYQMDADASDDILIEDVDTDFNDQAPEDLLDIANQAPIIRQVNTIFFKAVQARASDIHIEPYQNQVKLRFRVDGVLHDIMSLPTHQIDALISRLKIMSNLDIAERRLPQDGQSRIKIGNKEMDIRCSIIPTSGGERVVLRLLDKGGQELGIDHVGFTDAIKEPFSELILRPHGIILITGPTGSGKTTTLYSVLTELNSQERNILTVEDPIEYQLAGIGQMQVKPKIDLTFANCLRHILRQDPDVIMIGEIRDEQTARIAVQASLTGHLVFSTLHTNDAASAFSRLLDMQIEPYLISSSVAAVMAQRLVRSICPNCKIALATEQLDDQLAKQLNLTNFTGSFYHGTGCEQCLQTGYLGRSGIFELLLPDEQIQELINQRSPAHIIRTHAIEKGMTTLRQSGLFKAVASQTTLEEVLRVTQETQTIIEEGLMAHVPA